jgi:hypothetical protein
MKAHLAVYDPADPDALPRVIPDGIAFAARWPEAVGTIDPQWAKPGDHVKMIDSSGFVIAVFTVIDRWEMPE